MTAVDVIIRSCLLMTWDGRHGRTQTPCTQTLSHSCSHIEIFRCIISVTKTQYSVLADFLKKGFCTTICSQMTLHYFQNNLHPKIHLCYESENESVVTCVQTGKWFWKYFSPCLFFFLSLLALCRRGESRPLVMLLLGAINGNVSRLSKWWDLTYGIKASLDLHLLQMESALSQGVQHQGEAYWGIEKDKMTGSTFSLCLNYNLFQCI